VPQPHLQRRAQDGQRPQVQRRERAREQRAGAQRNDIGQQRRQHHWQARRPGHIGPRSRIDRIGTIGQFGA